MLVGFAMTVLAVGDAILALFCCFGAPLLLYVAKSRLLKTSLLRT